MRFAFDSEHQVNGTRVLPGVLYHEFVFEAAKALKISVGNSVRNMIWLHPFASEAGESNLSIEFIEDQGNWNFRFASESDSIQILHAQASCVVAAQEEPAIDLKTSKKRCGERKAKDDHYAQFRKRGMNHGPAMQGLKLLLHSGKEALAELQVPASKSTEHSDFLLHPAILDSASQCVTAILGTADAKSDELYLPIGLKNLIVYRKL